MILETSVGRVRVCVFAAFWQGATTTQASPCEEEGVPLARRNRQGAAKACNRARSVVTDRVIVEKALKANARADLRVIASGHLRFLG